MWKLKRDIEDNEDLLMLGAGYIYLQLQSKKINNKIKRRFWVRPTLQKRNLSGVDELLKNLQDDDIGLNKELRSSFKNFLRMSTHVRQCSQKQQQNQNLWMFTDTAND